MQHKFKKLIWSENWLSEIRNGDKVLLGQLYQVLLPKIVDWVNKNRGEKNVAHDIFQDALSDLILSDKNPHIDNPEAYIFQMCKFKYYRLSDHKHKTAPDYEMLNIISYDTQSYEELEIEKLKFQIMDQTFVQLSELCQKVINLLRGGKKPEQIATILEMSNANTVTRRKFACMASWIELVKMDKMYYLIKN